MNTITRCFAAALAFLVSSAAFAAKVETPESVPGVNTVTAAEVNTMIASGTVHVFDMRKATSYGRGHVPGAVATPWKGKIDKSVVAYQESDGAFDTSKLPSDKGAKLVFYSDGTTGWKSPKAAQLAVSMGYTDVNWMREGFSAWSANGLPTE